MIEAFAPWLPRGNLAPDGAPIVTLRSSRCSRACGATICGAGSALGPGCQPWCLEDDQDASIDLAIVALAAAVPSDG